MVCISKFIKYWGRGAFIEFDDGDKLLINLSKKDMKRLALKLNVEIDDKRN